DVLRASSALTLTYAALADTEPQLERVAAEVGPPVTVTSLNDSLTVQSNADTRLLSIVARDADPTRAAAIATAAAATLVDLAAVPGAGEAGRLTEVDPATAPDDPVEPNVTVVAAMAAGAGLVMAGAVAAVVEYFGGGIRTVHDLAKLAGIPAI